MGNASKQKRYRHVEYTEVVIWYCPNCKNENTESSFMGHGDTVECRQCHKECKLKDV